MVHDGSSHCAPQAPITIRTLASSAVGLYLHRSPQIYPQFGSTTSQSTNTFSNNVLTRTFRTQNHPVPRVKHTEATCTGLPGGGRTNPVLPYPRMLPSPVSRFRACGYSSTPCYVYRCSTIISRKDVFDFKLSLESKTSLRDMEVGVKTSPSTQPVVHINVHRAAMLVVAWARVCTFKSMSC